jgi:hypothetical protein
MATSLTLENDSSLAQGYIKVNGSTAATLTTSGITGNLTGNVTGNVIGNADTATKLAGTTGSAPSYACRAWVNFDGTRDTTGAVSTANTNRLIRSSGNVTSVLRNAAGDYTVTFTTPMSDANYSVVGTSSISGFATPTSTGIFGIKMSSGSSYQNKSTSAIQITVCDNSTDALFDTFDSNVAIFGN